MVAVLGPVKFYGSSLPRPRFYTDVKFSDERVDPPAPVLDPFLSWANEAHWSMGGLSFKRLRLQGRIEGNVKRLRAEREKLEKKKSQLSDSPSPVVGRSIGDPSKVASVESIPPHAPIVNKRRRRFVAVIDEDEEEEEDEVENSDDEFSTRKRRLARKLDDDFDRVASDTPLEREKRSPAKRPTLDLNTVPMRIRNKRSEKENVREAVRVTRSSSSSPATRTRSSSRLIKRV